jgi:hypothetical protein
MAVAGGSALPLDDLQSTNEPFMKAITGFRFAMILALMLLATQLSGCVSVLPNDGAETKVVRIDNFHAVRYIEVLLVGGNGLTGDLQASVYNSSAAATFDSKLSKDSAPQAWVEKLNVDELKESFHALGASINGPKLWMLDWVEIPVGKNQVFSGVAIPWVAELNLKGINLKETKSGKEAYQPLTIARKSKIGYNKGTTAYLLDDAEGNTWIMKGYQLGMNPAYSLAEYNANRESHFKRLPAGWKIRTKVLDQDLILVPENGLAIVTTDENLCAYDKTGPLYSNYKP